MTERNVNIPSSREPLADSAGLARRSWYQYWQDIYQKGQLILELSVLPTDSIMFVGQISALNQMVKDSRTQIIALQSQLCELEDLKRRVRQLETRASIGVNQCQF